MTNGTVVTLEAPLRVRSAWLRIVGLGVVIFLALVYIGAHLIGDLAEAKSPSVTPYLLLSLALLVALGFEFVNGFHDTANAVATVIYTNSLKPHVAVAWSGIWNLIGVLLSSGVVAFGIISLLPVELILQVGTKAGFAMVFALLVAAMVWNLATWARGLPASSSHTLIGSIIGVGLANQLMAPRTGASGVDWAQAANVGKSLLLSPLVGFTGAALLFLLSKALIQRPELYAEPSSNAPPPFWTRALLILTCTGVSFAHGSNDGQKGMGLIMLILIGTVPTAYALNHAVSPEQTQDFIAVSRQAAAVMDRHMQPGVVIGEPREELAAYVQTRTFRPAVVLGLRQTINDIANEMAASKQLYRVPADRIRNFRNDLYLVSETLRLMQRSGSPAFTDTDAAVLTNYRQHADQATKFIPGWVKVAVALALGLGTMIGWKRIVVTVGEKIGKHHLTYAQGAAAEITAMITIGAADAFALPVSTTHVLSSGIAGTMAANRSGLQWGTVRNLLMAWVLTMPASICLSALLFWTFVTMAK